MGVMNCIIIYLKFSPGKSIMFFKHGYLNIMGYIDANFVGFKLDRKSISE